MLMATALTCLSLNIYWEARGEPIVGQHAVAQVTMNRADRDPKKVCEVVTKPKQFSWTNTMLKRKKGQVVLTKKGEPTDEKAWQMAKTIAGLTLRGQIKDFTNGATFYHTKAVRPFWSKEFKLVMVIGQHRFYAYM